MAGARRFGQARTISLDFDGVLASLVLGRAWEKTRAAKKPIPLLSPLFRGLKTGLGSLTEGFRKPLPRAEEALREWRSGGRALYLLTSRTGPRIPAAERWLERYGWHDLFEHLFFNFESEDADRFKAKIMGSAPIDVHIDDDAETLAYLSGRFPERSFVHMNRYRRRSPAADNIVVVHSWEELPAVFAAGRDL